MQPLLLPGVCRQQAVSPVAVSGLVMTVFSPGLHAYCMGSLLRPDNAATNEEHCAGLMYSTVQYSTVPHSTVQCTNEDHCAGVLDTEVLAPRAHQQRHHLHRYNSTLLQLHNLNTQQYSDIRRTRLLAPSLCAF